MQAIRTTSQRCLAILLAAAIALGSWALGTQPATAAIRELQEGPDRVVYQARNRAYDANNQRWQTVAFKRLQPDADPMVRLRLVGILNSEELLHPHPLTIAVPGGDLLEAADVSDEPFTDESGTVPGNVGQYDLGPVIDQLPDNLELVLSVPTEDGNTIEIAVSPLVVREWQDVAQKEGDVASSESTPSTENTDAASAS